MKTKKIFIAITLLVAVAACALAVMAFTRSRHNVRADETLPDNAAEAMETPSEPPVVRLEDIVEFDKTVHDFGDVLMSDGPLSCTFTVKNISDKPIAIYNVVTSCGCTNVQWTREPISPGKTGSISATYTNDEGAFHFDKSLTAYITGIKKPILLHLRGVTRAKQQSLSELYPVHVGNLGLRGREFNCGNLAQGTQRSDSQLIANLGTRPLKVSFSNVSKGLSLNVAPNPIPAGKTATLTFTITTDREIWGANTYYATPVLDGKAFPKESDRLGIKAFTRENFSAMSQDEKNRGAQPMFDESSYSFGSVKAGEIVEASYTFTNKGKSPFKAYKFDSDNPKATLSGVIPEAEPGQKGHFKVRFDTSGAPKGESLVVMTITTNSPLRPIINLYISGNIE